MSYGAPVQSFLIIGEELVNLDQVVYVDLNSDNSGVEIVLAARFRTSTKKTNQLFFFGAEADALRAFFKGFTFLTHYGRDVMRAHGKEPVPATGANHA